VPQVVQCAACQRRYQTADALAGKTVRCAKCGATIEIPALRAEPHEATTKEGPQNELEALEPLEAEDAGRWEELTEEERTDRESAASRPSMTVAEIVRRPKPAPTSDLSELLDEALPSAPTQPLTPLPSPGSHDWGGGNPTADPARPLPTGEPKMTSDLTLFIQGWGLFMVGASLLLIVGAWILLALGSPAAWAITLFVAFLAGTIMFLGGTLWSLASAFSESLTHGILFLFVPFYHVYFVVRYWSDQFRPAMVALCGAMTMFTASISAGVSIVDQFDFSRFRQAEAKRDGSYIPDVNEPPPKGPDSNELARILLGSGNPQHEEDGIQGVIRRRTYAELSDGIRRFHLVLPGRDGGLAWVYLPAGSYQIGGSPCILLAPTAKDATSRMSAVVGRRLTSGDVADHLSWASQGFVVVAVEMDGAVPDPDHADPNDLDLAIGEFIAGDGGARPLRAALGALQQQVPEVDLKRVYVAGHGIGGGAAIRAAMAERSRIAGCALLAPVVNLLDYLDAETLAYLEQVRPGVRRDLERLSFVPGKSRITCPTFVFHARGDARVPVSQSNALFDALEQARVPVFSSFPSGGDHYATSYRSGTDEAIRWLRQVDQTIRSGGRVKLTRATSPRVAVAPRKVEPTGPKFAKGLLGDSQRAFFVGEGRLGMRYRQAAVLSGENPVDWKDVLRWCPDLKRPSGSLHFAFGVQWPSDEAPPPEPNSSGTRMQQQAARFAQMVGATSPTAEMVSRELQRRIDEGQFGAWGLEPRRGAQEPRRITVLGVGHQDELIEAARREESDVLVTIYRQQQVLLGGKTDVTIRLRVLDPATGTPLWFSSPLTGNRRAIALQRHEADPLQQLVADMMAYLDERIALGQMPAISSQLALKRCQALAVEKDRPLGPLLEIFAYAEQGLITPEARRDCCMRLIGEQDAASLLDGDDVTRSAVAKRLAQREPPDSK